MWERFRKGVPPNPDPSELPSTAPEIAIPRADVSETRVTWVGHSTVLIQHAGLNLVTDPHWSERAAPVQWTGPARLVPPGVDFDQIPPLDAVILSHDHYDHLDDRTVRRIAAAHTGATWFAPLGYRDWLSRRNVRKVVELDWWKSAPLEGVGGSARITALPAQHWTRRGLRSQDRLWASWGISTEGRGSIYFGGDSGYFPGFRMIGERLGPFDVALLPIGAYEPRWFMKHDHMNPQEAVQAYLDLGGRGVFGALHWGTFRLTDEDPLEPPMVARAEWHRKGLDDSNLWIPRHGETRILSG